ncbi:MAG: hypothetical protein ABS873_02620, partial [Alkalibacterium sp.]
MTDSYETMPKSNAHPKGMKMVRGDKQNVRARIVPEDLIYQRKNGRNLRLRLVYPEGYDLEGPYPVLGHVQGSGWFQQDLNNVIMDFTSIVTRGFVLAIV